MAICKCGSQAINDGAHGRIKGKRLDLYWEQAGRKVIAPSVFEGYEGQEWPDFKW